MSYPFNVRVYFLLWDAERSRLLFSREKIGNHLFWKFPGGGLEFGEGTLECAIREGQEELGITITPLHLLGITDTYVPSLFKEGEQVLAVYYLASCEDYDKVPALPEIPNDDRSAGMIWISPSGFDTLPLELASDKTILKKFSDSLRNQFA